MSRARTSKRFLEVDDELERLEQAHAGEDGILLKRDAPPEYLELHRVWERLVAASTTNWLTELGEQEIAWLAQEEPREFQTMIVAGQLKIGMGIDDPAIAIEAATHPDQT
jgi:hypothetical protein